jgi:predicted Zn-dependent peptidase
LRWTKNAPAVKDKDVLAFTIANYIFNVVLFKEIREIGGKTYNINSSHTYSQFSNLFSINCSVRSSEMLNTIELFDKTLQNFSTANFSKEEFDNQITRFKTDLLSTEHPEQIADLFNPITRDFNTRKNILNDLNALKMEDVQKVIKKYYTPGIYKLAIAGDERFVASQLEKIKNLIRYTPADLESKN